MLYVEAWSGPVCRHACAHLERKRGREEGEVREREGRGGLKGKVSALSLVFLMKSYKIMEGNN